MHEAENIKDVMAESADRINIAVAVASDMSSSPSMSNHSSVLSARLEGEPLRLVFLSRIVPMKNLDFALRVLSKVSVSVSFHIFGPIEDESYWKVCETFIADLPPNVVVRYEKEVNHAEVLTILEAHDLFFLPTRGENYGHVIMESLSVGTPVLIADTTPWRNLEQAGVGWELPLDNEQIFADKINYAFQISNDAYGRWRDNVRLYAYACATNPEILNSNRNLFLGLIKNNKNFN
jgi:glycosyltransferase involved in cell wall biosynthesis